MTKVRFQEPINGDVLTLEIPDGYVAMPNNGGCGGSTILPDDLVYYYGKFIPASELGVKSESFERLSDYSWTFPVLRHEKNIV